MIAKHDEIPALPTEKGDCYFFHRGNGGTQESAINRKCSSSGKATPLSSACLERLLMGNSCRRFSNNRNSDINPSLSNFFFFKSASIDRIHKNLMIFNKTYLLLSIELYIDFYFFLYVGIQINHRNQCS